MRIWAISDLHLAISVPQKTMAIFGPHWQRYMEQIQENWLRVVAPEDLVLLGGDLSWAMKLEQAKIDLAWIDSLPGTKVMIRGNHDYWWSSIGKVRSLCSPTMHAIQNDAITLNGISLAGTRLWDTNEFALGLPVFKSSLDTPTEDVAEQEKIFERELQRLEMSLKCLDQTAKRRIVLVHYPPLGAGLEPTRTSQLLERYNVDTCIFGHLHNVDPNFKGWGQLNGIRYVLTSCDYLRYIPIEV